MCNIFFVKLIHNQNTFITGMTKLLVATSSQGSATVEVISFDDLRPNVTCANLPNLPIALEGATGILFEGTTPIICGRDTNAQYSCFCFKLESGNWKTMILPPRCRYSPASVALMYNKSKSESFVLTGGFSNNNFDVFDGQTWSQIVPSNIPLDIFSHCTVNINSTLFVIIGGQNSNISKSTYFCDSAANLCYPGPDLNTARIFHACGTMNWLNPLTNVNEKLIVVVGGYNVRMLKSVELLNVSQFLQNSQGWILGPDLPSETSFGWIFDFENTVIIGGGLNVNRGTEFLQLASPNGNWVEKTQHLSAARYGHIMFLINDASANS